MSHAEKNESLEKHEAHESHAAQAHSAHPAHHGGHVSKVPPGYQNAKTKAKRGLKKYQLPVVGHFANKSIRFKSIIEAEKYTGIHYTLIFEACIGKIYKAKNVFWEYEKGNHFIKYKAYYINAQDHYTRHVGFNG